MLVTALRLEQHEFAQLLKVHVSLGLPEFRRVLELRERLELPKLMRLREVMSKFIHADTREDVADGFSKDGYVQDVAAAFFGVTQSRISDWKGENMKSTKPGKLSCDSLPTVSRN